MSAKQINTAQGHLTGLRRFGAGRGQFGATVSALRLFGAGSFRRGYLILIFFYIKPYAKEFKSAVNRHATESQIYSTYILMRQNQTKTYIVHDVHKCYEFHRYGPSDPPQTG